ncbi:YaeQ family protein [Desulfoluna sp.]|uniref:YaeQ family protein n=1 Tax=Desulfoluna sp. TaxID=2045199 RepID=UPI0026386D62|nr:YaeQ family protein [Desulfoluna sp.]
MALKATVYKTELQVSDLDRNHYETYHFTVAKHPSETDERMMIRLIAFALYADENLLFTRGLSSDSEPELWQISPSGEIDLWIELGQPDEKRIRKACGKAREVVIVSYGDRKAEPWWEKNREALSRCGNLTVLYIPIPDGATLASMVQRTMQLEFTLDDGHIWLISGETSLDIVPVYWKKKA